MVEARGESGVGHVTTLRPRADGGVAIARSVDNRRRCGQPGFRTRRPERPVGGARPPRQDAAAAGVLVFAAGVALVSVFFSVFFSVGVELGELSEPASAFATALPAPSRLSVR
jgi:hypothetical protein